MNSHRAFVDADIDQFLTSFHAHVIAENRVAVHVGRIDEIDHQAARDDAMGSSVRSSTPAGFFVTFTGTSETPEVGTLLYVGSY